jgi:hypothetical protein
MPSTGSPPSGFKRQSVCPRMRLCDRSDRDNAGRGRWRGCRRGMTDLDPRLDKVRAQRTCRDLQFQTVERYAIVVADLTFLLHAKNLLKIDPRNRDESAAVLLRLDGKAGVVDREIDITKKQIGRGGFAATAFCVGLCGRDEQWNSYLRETIASTAVVLSHPDREIVIGLAGRSTVTSARNCGTTNAGKILSSCGPCPAGGNYRAG